MRFGSKVSALQPESGVECDAAIPRALGMPRLVQTRMTIRR
jgi:hypothetical protein